MSFLIDPPWLYANGRAYGQLTRSEPDPKRDALFLGATMAVFWGVSVALYLDKPWTRPIWRLCRASSGRDWMLNSGVLRMDARRARTPTHVISTAIFATYPYWLWRACERGVAAGPERPRPPARLRVAEFSRPLREEEADPDPFRQFAAWYEEAARSGVRDPEAAALATASADGAPSVRMVLVKQRGERGFTFFTNYESRKGSELAANPRAALLFHWDPVGRQVRIEGPVERLEPSESAAYVRTRPRTSQLSALASRQSRPLAGREELERRVAELAARHDGSELPVPDFWGGFRLTPEGFEFWQHRDDRLHDRLRYSRADAGWRIERLAP